MFVYGQDKAYVPVAGVPGIIEVGQMLFFQFILRSLKYPIQPQLISTLLSQIRLERDGEVINRSAVRDAVLILINLQYGGSDLPTTGARHGGPWRTVYETDFEEGFLEWTAVYYKDEGQRLVEECEAGIYLKKVGIVFFLSSFRYLGVDIWILSRSNEGSKKNRPEPNTTYPTRPRPPSKRS